MPQPSGHLLNRILPYIQNARGPLDPAAFWESIPRKAGERIQAGPTSIQMPFDGYHVFVDLHPGANWSHPALSILVPEEEEQEIQVVQISFPPFPGDPEPPYIKLELP